jgi:hypothetical protein
MGDRILQDTRKRIDGCNTRVFIFEWQLGSLRSRLFQVCSRFVPSKIGQPGTAFLLEPQRFFFIVPSVPSKNKVSKKEK